MQPPTNECDVAVRIDDARGERSLGFVVVAVCATLIFAFISLAPGGSVAKYRYSFVFLVPIVWVAFALRRRIHLGLLPFAAFAFALLLHDLGAFGWYQRRVLSLQYDWYVHAFFGFVGGWIAARALHEYLHLRGWSLAVLVVLVITGIGGLHEIMESASTMVLGTDYGMLIVGADDPLDTQEDLLNNVIGSSIAAAIYASSLRAKPRSV